MDIKKFEEIVGPTVERIKKEQRYRASSSFRPLAELLVEWFERKDKEWAAFAKMQEKKHDKSD